MKFFCTKLQLPPEPLTKGLPPPDPRSLCPLFSAEFVEPPPKKIPGYATVAQGGIIYALLFILYVNDIPTPSLYFRLALSADDTFRQPALLVSYLSQGRFTLTSRFRSVIVPSPFRQIALCSHCLSSSVTFRHST